MSDLISRQAAIDAINCLINRFEQILRDIRESKVDDSVCGMCEYDGAFVGQSGYWCNECPGFEKDDCFKLSDECRKRWLESVKLPSAQQWIPCSERLPYAECGESDTVLTTCGYRDVEDTSIRWIRLLYFNGGNWCYPTGETYKAKVYAWCPLPEPWKGDTP